jgi:ABC-2 family transporter protein
MVIDKETKMRETLKILSMRTSAYGLSYFFSQLVFIAIISLLMTITYLAMKYLSGGDSILFFLVMLIHGISMTFFSMALTTIFSDSKISVQLGSLALVLPLALFIGLLNYANWHLYLGYWLP